MSNSTTITAPARVGWLRDWPRWAPYAVMVWSVVYAALGLYWALGGRGFPYDAAIASDAMSPLAGRFGPVIAWIFIIVEGLPAVAIGVMMLRGVRRFRTFLITAAILLAAILLMLMTGLNLLVEVGYIPGVLLGLLTAERSQAFRSAWTQWTTIHQLLCIVGGFLWLAATISYARRSVGACQYCGRRDGPEGWTSSDNARRWGRIAVFVAMAPPVLYALTRIAWALGIPLGMSEAALRSGQESGIWIGGLSLAAFCLVGAALMLGLVQRWGEVFPRWMIGLAGRKVPIGLALIPALLASVLLIVGGIGIWSGLPQMVVNLKASGVEGASVIWDIIVQVGPTLLFPVWGGALAVATFGYYFRRRGQCGVCGRGSAG
jgi:hypothetical protein